MGMLRKSISITLTLSLILVSTRVLADGPTTPKASTATPKTKYSYDSNNICSKAPDMMTKLNAENDEKIKRIESLKSEIDDVNNAMVILNGVDKIKRSYEDALKEIESQKVQSLAEQEKDKFKTLDSMKKVIRNGLTINALALLLKDGDLDQDNAFKVETICSKGINTNEPLCKNEMSFTQQLKNKFVNNPLDQMLLNFRNAYKKVKTDDKDILKEEIKKIINSIPDSISPQAILSLLDRTSPGISAILVTQTNKDELTKCLSPDSSKEVLESCEKLLPKKNNVSATDGQSELSFLNQMNNETTAAVKGIHGLSEVINDALRANIKSFNSQMQAYTNIGKDQNPQLSQRIGQVRIDVLNQAKIVKASIESQKDKKPDSTEAIDIAKYNAKVHSKKLTGLSTLFYNPDFKKVVSAQDVDNTNEAEMKKAILRAQNWDAKCLQDIKDVDINFCRKEIEEVSTKINGLKTEFKNKLGNLETEFKKISYEEDNKFSKVETLKRFIAEKYLRECVDSSKIKSNKKTISFDIQIDGKCFSGGHSLSTLDGLSNDVSKIILNTKFAQEISASKDSTGTFSKKEMEEFKNVCSMNKDIATTHNDICKVINEEKIARNTVLDKSEVNAKWEKFNEDNWVRYDDKSKNGYSYTKKKSALSVFGAGVLPIVPQILPTFLGNYLMQQNIESMTNQAIYQKQMLHNFDIYNNNPWMYNFNYFGTSVPGYGNPFSTTTGVNNTTGFGF